MKKENYYNIITAELNHYIMGEVPYSSICNATCCRDIDDDSSPSIAAHLKLVECLQKKDTI